MSSQGSPKGQVGCLAVVAILMVLITYWTTRSLNPIAVYASDSIVGKVAVSVLAGLMAVSVVMTIYAVLTRKMIESTAHRPAVDVICPGCGHPLLQFIGSHGPPILCPNCRRWWHNGPACYNKYMPQSRIAFALYPCPQCRSAALHDR